MKKIDHISFEKYVIKVMIRIYCQNKHCESKKLCVKCEALYEYCVKRLDRCLFADEKPACQNCKIHCYEKEMRKRVREIMSYSGPRMIFKHPIMSLKHLYQNKTVKALNLKEFKELRLRG